ncbi:MAG: cytochrome C oxidase subunit IV family protein [Sphingomonadales bacterium]|jgi:hypothetical protein|nr:cytochrome C oxidase subunit IV family protein [Sphingomonadales bacterium]
MRDSLFRAWLALVALSGASALLSRHGARWVGVAVLLLGLVKARIILVRYLGLGQTPGWMRGFDGGLVVLTALLIGLFLAA